jgi:hypothetical protein
MTVRNEFIAVKSMADWIAVLERHYASDAPGREPLDDVDETVECDESHAA